MQDTFNFEFNGFEPSQKLIQETTKKLINIEKDFDAEIKKAVFCIERGFTYLNEDQIEMDPQSRFPSFYNYLTVPDNREINWKIFTLESFAKNTPYHVEFRTLNLWDTIIDQAVAETERRILVTRIGRSSFNS